MDGTSPGFRPDEREASGCQANECRANEGQAGPRCTSRSYAHAGIEPPVEELLADPMLHKLLVRDRITLAETRRAVSEARRRLGL
ncbi:MAG TPA: hypothetical protein VL574_05175 [Stellaceae bacterium]|jgi:hypothetical protein|nr:hypothetical protein [Stellaceae bacterium]